MGANSPSMSAQTMTTEEIQTRGWQALVADLGPVNAARFVMQNNLGSGDYTAEREALIGHLTVDQIIADIEAVRKN